MYKSFLFLYMETFRDIIPVTFYVDNLGMFFVETIIMEQYY